MCQIIYQYFFIGSQRKLSRTLRSSSLSGDHPKVSRRKRRVKVIEEIIHTEESYVAHLGELIELFAKPLEPIVCHLRIIFYYLKLKFLIILKVIN